MVEMQFSHRRAQTVQHAESAWALLFCNLMYDGTVLCTKARYIALWGYCYNKARQHYECEEWKEADYLSTIKCSIDSMYGGTILSSLSRVGGRPLFLDILYYHAIKLGVTKRTRKEESKRRWSYFPMLRCTVDTTYSRAEWITVLERSVDLFLRYISWLLAGMAATAPPKIVGVCTVTTRDKFGKCWRWTMPNCYYCRIERMRRKRIFGLMYSRARPMVENKRSM